MFNFEITDCQIRTRVLWYWKQPLCKLCHKHANLDLPILSFKYFLFRRNIYQKNLSAALEAYFTTVTWSKALTLDQIRPNLAIQSYLLMGHPRPIFRPFQCIHYSFHNKIHMANVQYRDSNPRPLEHESKPITNRPALPPKITPFFFTLFLRLKLMSFKQC